jgi:hypothetical protein
MNDFNLRPEVMGFGRPERLLVAQPTPKPPADDWKALASGPFEVNGLGQLRTVLALPASEAEIAASMRHADAPPTKRKDGITFMGNRFYTDDDIYKMMADAKGVSTVAPMIFANPVVGEPLTLRKPQAAAWNASTSSPSLVHTDACQCDGCRASEGAGRFASTKKIMVDTGKSVVAKPAESAEIGTPEIRSALIAVAHKHGKLIAKGVLQEFGAERLRDVRQSDYDTLLARLQSELDIPF